MPVAPDDILRSYEVKWSVCARNNTIYNIIAFNKEPHAKWENNQFTSLFM